MGSLRGLEVSIVSYNYLDFTSEANHVRPKKNMVHECGLAIKLAGVRVPPWGFTYDNAGQLETGVCSADNIPPVGLTSLMCIQQLNHVHVSDTAGY